MDSCWTAFQWKTADGNSDANQVIPNAANHGCHKQTDAQQTYGGGDDTSIWADPADKMQHELAQKMQGLSRMQRRCRNCSNRKKQVDKQAWCASHASQHKGNRASSTERMQSWTRSDVKV